MQHWFINCSVCWIRIFWKFFQQFRSVRPFRRQLPRHVTIRGVEIGTNRGRHARRLLDLPNLHLVCVDPYISYGENGFTFHKDESAKRVAHRRLGKLVPRVVMIEKQSVEAAAMVPSDLDFVYIDGLHDYDGVRADIAAWWPKMKSGGVFGGHDFNVSWPGVIRAVTEFAVENKLQLHVDFADWWVYKP
jgi:hypothetical protein